MALGDGSSAMSPVEALASVCAAYPGGVVPGVDYLALLTVLRRHLSVDDVERVATQLVVRGLNALTGVDLRAALTGLPDRGAATGDLDRVTDRLTAAGWTGAGDQPAG